jgi:hypothetical protein
MVDRFDGFFEVVSRILPSLPTNGLSVFYSKSFLKQCSLHIAKSRNKFFLSRFDSNPIVIGHNLDKAIVTR